MLSGRVGIIGQGSSNALDCFNKVSQEEAYLSRNPIDIEFDHVLSTRVVHRFPFPVLWVDDAANNTCSHKHLYPWIHEYCI